MGQRSGWVQVEVEEFESVLIALNPAVGSSCSLSPANSTSKGNV